MNYDFVEQAKDYLLYKIGSAPDVAVILGSGLSAVDEILRDTVRIDYSSIPNFPVPRAAGHRGEVVYGRLNGTNVIAFEGRVHYYEGNTMDRVTFCARVIGRSGAKTLLIANAAGGINPNFTPGQLMLIQDHINFLGVNPLAGPNDHRWGPRFIDQTEVYDSRLRQQLRDAAAYCGLEVVEGVYVAVAGPTYETPAEIRFLRNAGADVVGMSTVPEAIVARHMGLRVAGISMIANLVAGLADKPIDHEDVLTKTSHMNADVGLLLQRFFEIYAE